MLWHHRYASAEIRAAIGLEPADIDAALKQVDIRPEARPRRHDDRRPPPRIGFLEGAFHPLRGMKVSIFAPLDETSYGIGQA
jgi:hypothetical protein